MTQNSNMKQGEKIIVHVDAELEDLIPGFLENRHKDIKSMLEALEQGDYETIQVMSHRIKGAGGSYGFDAITDIGRSIEQAAKSRESEVIRKWVDQLSNYLQCVEVVYK